MKVMGRNKESPDCTFVHRRQLVKSITYIHGTKFKKKKKELLGLYVLWWNFYLQG